MKVVVLLIASVCMISSCKSVMSKMYGLNKPMNFTTKEEYIDYVENKRKIKRSDILLVDSADFGSLWSKALKTKAGYYLGTYINDSVSVRRTDFLKENTTCLARVLDNISLGMKSRESLDSLTEPDNFNEFQFYECSSGEKYSMSNSEKPIKIFLLYQFSSGRLFDTSFREIFDFAEQNRYKVEVKVIPMDLISVVKQEKN